MMHSNYTTLTTKRVRRYTLYIIKKSRRSLCEIFCCHSIGYSFQVTEIESIRTWPSVRLNTIVWVVGTRVTLSLDTLTEPRALPRDLPREVAYEVELQSNTIFTISPPAVRVIFIKNGICIPYSKYSSEYYACKQNYRHEYANKY